MVDMQRRYEGAPDRRRSIVGTLRSSGFVSSADLADRLGVSDMTIRRDLQKLEELGELRVVRGGASLPEGSLQHLGFENRAGANTEEKRTIARTAAALVATDDSVAIDASTTTCLIADAFSDDFAGCVVTHSVPVISGLMSRRPVVRVVGLGGDLLHSSGAFVGPMTVDAVANVRVRMFFLGAAAIDARGVYVAADTERPTKLALMDAADEVVLLVDHSKFETSAPVRLCGLDRLSAVVTGRRPPAGVRDQLAAEGVRLHIAAD